MKYLILFLISMSAFAENQHHIVYETISTTIEQVTYIETTKVDTAALSAAAGQAAQCEFTFETQLGLGIASYDNKLAGAINICQRFNDGLWSLGVSKQEGLDDELFSGSFHTRF